MISQKEIQVLLPEEERTWGKQTTDVYFKGYTEGVIQATEPPTLSGAILKHKVCHVSTETNEKSRSPRKPEGHTRTMEITDLLIQKDW